MVLMDLAKTWGHEQVVFCQDAETGLKAIIAIHDTTLGPALGGCRFWDYQSEEEALFDVLRLSRGMTYKAAVAGLPLGGGKSVLIGNAQKLRSPALFKRFGLFVQGLNGRYITAEDVNCRVEDMNYVAQETAYVTGVTARAGGSGDPSPITALGIFSGIKAAAKFRLQRDSLQGLKVAIQGCGAVGSHLAQLLHTAGASLVLADINQAAVQELSQQLGATVVSTDTIHSQQVDIFAPCALGAILNDTTIPAIKAPVIAGGANNQLLDETKHMQQLQERNILYAPDYVINAGGLINVCHELKGYQAEAAKTEARKIYDTLLGIFADAEKRGITTLAASNALAEQRIAAARAQGDVHLRHTFNNQSWIKRSL